MRILVLSTAIPFSPIGGGKLRTYQLLRALAGRHEITLAGFTFGEEPGEAPFPVRVVAVPWEEPPLYRQMKEDDPATAQRAADQLGREGDEPWSVSWAESAAMDAAIHRLVQDPFDMVLLEGTPMARFLPALPLDVPCILDFMDIYSRMILRDAEIKPGEDKFREAERTRLYERRVASRCDLCLAVSEQEAAAARELLGIEPVIIPNGVDTTYFTPVDDEPDSASLLFTGTMSYGPNSEAARYFVQSILPRICEEMPRATLHIVGAAPPPEVLSLAGPNVVVHGLVPDMRPYYHRAAVVVVPLLRGGGTKLKVLEAAASGKAIVSTSVGTEGLPFRDGEDLIVAGSEPDFAQAVLSLIPDRTRQRQLGARARQASLQFDWEKIGDRLREVVETLVVGSRAS